LKFRRSRRLTLIEYFIVRAPRDLVTSNACSYLEVSVERKGEFRINENIGVAFLRVNAIIDIFDKIIFPSLSSRPTQRAS